MKHYVMDVTAGGATLRLRDGPVPEPAANQVLVRMRAASLNRGEFILGHGLHKAGSAKPIGMEGAGEIAQVGPGVTGLAVGQRIMGRCAGAFAEFALLDAREAIAMPPSLSWEQGASIPLTFLVVHDMLVTQGRLKPGEWLLVTGISAGVGVAALQAAKALGARVIGTSGSPDKLDRLKASGLDVGIHTRSGDFHDAVMQATGGKGADLIVNNVGGSVFAECIRSLAFEGRLATVGYVDGVLESTIDIQALHAKRLTLFGVSNKLRTADQKAASVPPFVADFMPAIATGHIAATIDRVYPFEELDAAKAYMESNQQVGKIVLKMPESAA